MLAPKGCPGSGWPGAEESSASFLDCPTFPSPLSKERDEPSRGCAMAFNAHGRPALGLSPGDSQSRTASTACHWVSGLKQTKCTVRSWPSTSATSQKPHMGVLGCLITHPHSPCPDLAGRAPFTEDEGSPRKLLIFLFHWRTMLETERAPDSGSEEVVLAETSAPESSMAGFWLVLPATRSDMGLARRRSAETCPGEGVRQASPAQTCCHLPQGPAAALEIQSPRTLCASWVSPFSLVAHPLSPGSAALGDG